MFGLWFLLTVARKQLGRGKEGRKGKEGEYSTRKTKYMQNTSFKKSGDKICPSKARPSDLCPSARPLSKVSSTSQSHSALGLQLQDSIEEATSCETKTSKWTSQAKGSVCSRGYVPVPRVYWILCTGCI